MHCRLLFFDSLIIIAQHCLVREMPGVLAAVHRYQWIFCFFFDAAHFDVKKIACSIRSFFKAHKTFDSSSNCHEMIPWSARSWVHITSIFYTNCTPNRKEWSHLLTPQGLIEKRSKTAWNPTPFQGIVPCMKLYAFILYNFILTTTSIRDKNRSYQCCK